MRPQNLVFDLLVQLWNVLGEFFRVFELSTPLSRKLTSVLKELQMNVGQNQNKGLPV